ncbi:hypothetical protein [Streptomyces sp. NPDC002187]|uniref:hypothetical protein n=1 Tax=Streptomyces sp. NPDC002187 TaxID=3364637 RepID=UPI0036C820EB
MSGPRGQTVKEVELSGDLDGEHVKWLTTIAGICAVQRMFGDAVHVHTRTTVRPAAAAAA